MPTYQNRTGVVTTFGEYQFAPFETRVINRNIFYRQPIVCTDINPIYNPYVLRIKNATNNTPCVPFIHNHSFIIRIDDEFPPEDKLYDENYRLNFKNKDGDIADIGVWVTIGDPRIRFFYQLMRVITFERRNNYWYAKDPGAEKVPTGLLDIEYEVVYLSILKLTASSIDLSTKPF